MYKPPGSRTWSYSHCFMEEYKEAYDQGYEAAQKGAYEERPYILIGVERGSAFEHDMNKWWHQGYWDFE